MRVRSLVRRLALVVALIPSLALAAPRARVVADRPDLAGGAPTGSVCSRGEIRCFAHVQITEAGALRAADAPQGLDPEDLQSAYRVDASIAGTPTVAIVVAYGYANLESDLAVYRQQFGLPPCTRGNGCLRIVNQNGQTSPLPPDPPPDDDWTVETALDMDMVSAVCPGCRILIVQANDPSKLAMYTAQRAAAAARPAVISDSWGAIEAGDLTIQEPFFDHPGIAQFVAAGDSGFNEGGRGPAYPSTSAHVIAVGGTALVPAPNTRGWTETAWQLGGSSCSLSIARPAFQPASPCARRVAADIAAVGDPATGVSVFNAANDGWLVLGGTSAAAPIVAALFASIGHGDITAAQLSQSTAALFDITAGRNGSCGNVLCNAGTGWDGPTGYGAPNAALLASGGIGGGGSSGLDLRITAPADNAMVRAGFQVTATASANPTTVRLSIDGDSVQTAAAAPYEFTTPTSLAPGVHRVQVAAEDDQGREVVAEIRVTVTARGGFGFGSGGGEGGPGTARAGCQASQPGPSLGVLLVRIAAAAMRRSRRRAR